jgi:hypothetical protein
MLHVTINYILFVVVICLLWWCCHQRKHETFTTHDQLSHGPFTAQPTPPYDVSVFSSVPKQHAIDTSYAYAIPFQSACVASNDVTCPTNKAYTCFLTPHNRRMCHWSWLEIYFVYFMNIFFARPCLKKITIFSNNIYCWSLNVIF